MTSGVMERVLELNQSPTRSPAKPDVDYYTLNTPSRKRQRSQLAMLESPTRSNPFDRLASFSQMQASPASSIASDPSGLYSSPASGTPSSHSSAASPTTPSSGSSNDGIYLSPYNDGLSLASEALKTLLNTPQGKDNTDLESACTISPLSFDGNGFMEARPDFKRRRTAPAYFGSSLNVVDSPGPSPISRTPSSPSKRGSGINGENVWPPEIDVVFHEALQFVPRLGRRKVVVGQKAMGRNELIAAYIWKVAGVERSRKQVSSHVQVLKQSKRDDPIFMALVSEPPDADNVDFPKAKEDFFLAIERQRSPICTLDVALPMVQRLNRPGSPMIRSLSDSGNMLSPASAAFPQAYRNRRSQSATPSPLLSPTVSPLLSPAVSECSSMPAVASPFTRPDSTSPLLSVFEQQMLIKPPVQEPEKVRVCPMAPTALKLWLESDRTIDSHIIASLDKILPVKTVYLEDLPNASTRFPGIADMHDHTPCQFMHVLLNMALPKPEDGQRLETLRSAFVLSSATNVDITSVTSVYCRGERILCMEEDLRNAFPISRKPDSGADLTADLAYQSRSKLFRYNYCAPFATSFWTAILTSAQSTAPNLVSMPFAKSTEERFAFGEKLSQLTFVQEFVYKLDAQEMAAAQRQHMFSPGTGLGNVLLCVVYEFALQDHPSADISFLQLKRPMTSLPSAYPVRPALRSQPASELPNVDEEVAVPSIKLEEVAPKMHVPIAVKPNRFVNKANLSLRIPTGGVDSQPISTPLPQMVHTPTAPPPVQQFGDPEHTKRLGRHWAASSGDWNMASPALAGSFPIAMPLPSPSFNPNLPTDLGNTLPGAALFHMTTQAMANGATLQPALLSTPEVVPLGSSFALPNSQPYNMGIDPSLLFMEPSDYFSMAI